MLVLCGAMYVHYKQRHEVVMADSRRTDDPSSNKRFFRSERYIVTNGAWYFATREGEQGPFKTRTGAEVACARFIQEQATLSRVTPLNHRIARTTSTRTRNLIPANRQRLANKRILM